ncbi:proteasome complex subunit Rpn13 ubiquitin receptor-domain-containing protein [Entophlyctis helioformis]|nr:proteasome complex subunit Rpn13 ubiquitin receptor-domain-containing protein [Entophlyctis helioformis]
MVTPDHRKGLLFLSLSEDGFLHLCWKDRAFGIVEDNLILFPGDAKLVHLPQSSSGRAYMLRFASSSRRLFFWIQEPSRDRSDQLVNRFNHILDNPPDSLDSEMVQSVPRQSNDPVFVAQLETLRGVLASINVANDRYPDQVDLSSILTADRVGPLLNNTQVSSVLFPRIPASDTFRTLEEIETIMSSTEFAESIQFLRVAAQSGALGPIIQEIGEDADDEGVCLFLQDLQDLYRRE